jgi:voltage-gated potassium channel
MMQPGGTLRRVLSERRHTALLIAIVVTFAVRPLFGESDSALIAFSFALMLVLLLAVYTTQVDELLGDRDVLLAQRRRRHILVWALAVPALLERIYEILTPSRQLYLAGPICWLLFLAVITWSQLRTLLKHREVTSETIAMSISVYLLLGLSWGMLYIAIFELHPDAFRFASTPTAALTPHQQHTFPILIYFSLTSLSTIGFGDIIPLTLQARYAAVAEGITGQFYLAILVARLVGMHMSRASDARTGSQ